MVESSAMSDVDSISAMRIGPRSERSPRLDEVDTVLLRFAAPVHGAGVVKLFGLRSGDNE
jgi:hypothetical protein